jgi:hypothetical protein
MLDRNTLVSQIAKILEGDEPQAQKTPTAEARQRADRVLSKVEVFLGVEIEEARDILARVLEDVS